MFSTVCCPNGLQQQGQQKYKHGEAPIQGITHLPGHDNTYSVTTRTVGPKGKWLTELYSTQQVHEHLNDGALVILMATFKLHPKFGCEQLQLPDVFQRKLFDESQMTSCRKMPGCFGDVEGYLGRDNHGTVFPLAASWFDDNPEDRQHKKELDQNAANLKYPWIRVRPGKRSGLRTRLYKSVLQDLTSLQPTISVPQTRIVYRQYEGERNCYLTSFASALHAFGMQSDSRIIHALGRAMPVTEHPNSFMHRIVEKHFRGSFQLKKCRDKKNRFDPLRNRCTFPTVVLLKQKGKHSYPHCVSFYRNMLFESSLPFALKKTRDNLDYVCGGTGEYLGVWWSKRLQPIGTTIK